MNMQSDKAVVPERAMNQCQCHPVSVRRFYLSCRNAMQRLMCTQKLVRVSGR